MVVTQSATIYATADKVWDVLLQQIKGPDSSDARGVHRKDEWAHHTSSTPSNAASDRVIVWDKSNKTLTREVALSFPFLTQQGDYIWKLRKTGRNRTRINMKMKLAANPIIGIFLLPFMKCQLGKMTRETVRGLRNNLQQVP